MLRPPAVDGRDYVQQNQPAGVPPLELTGERTLPDVPEENYWYRRHLAVYEWIAARCRRAAGRRPGLRRGLRLRRAGRHARPSVVGVDANPEAHEHARLRYVRPNLRFERDLVEELRRALRRDRLPADDRARRATPGRSARAASRALAPVVLRLDPQPAHPGAARGARSPTTPGTCASTRSRSTASCSSRTSRGSRCSASSTPASCAPTSSRSSSAGTASTRRCGSPSPSTTASSRRSPPPTSRCADGRPRRGAGLRRRLPCLTQRARRRPRDRPALATCPTSRASAPTRSARSGCSTR